MQKELTGQATPEAIVEMKSKYTNPFSIEVGGHIGYFREPDLDDLNFAASQVDADAPLDFNKIIMKETMIGGSEDLINVQALFMGASKKISKKIDGEKAKLVEL